MNDLEIMSDPYLWPKDVILPLVKPTGTGPITGFLAMTNAQVQHVEPVIYLGNIWDLSHRSLMSFPQQCYDSLQAILDDGWHVDLTGRSLRKVLSTLPRRWPYGASPGRVSAFQRRCPMLWNHPKTDMPRNGATRPLWQA